MNEENDILQEVNYTLGRTAFEPGKSLSQQLREERERIAKEMQPLRDKRTRIDMMNNPDISKRSGYFIDRSYYLDFKDPISLLEPLEKKVIQVLELKYPTIRLKVRFHDVVYAKKLFTFFALTYLNLTSFEVAEYLKLDRSTLSYHLHHMMDIVDVYQKYQKAFIIIDQWLYDRADSVGYRKYKSAYFSHKREKVKS